MTDLHPAFQALAHEHPALNGILGDLQAMFDLLVAGFQGGGKLLLCGNGGSACDCEHIAGELMKGFLLKRTLTSPEKTALAIAGDNGILQAHLQRALPVLVLHGLPGMSTAFLNDVDGDLTFAQQAFAYAQPGDVLLGLSTSGNAKNVCFAAIASKARGAKVLGLTGDGGGWLADLCDVCIKVPAHETWRVQEMHLPIYHALCMALEQRLFGGDEA
ncbi:MAG: SIS domain-containing protein [Eubacteriales bacterium]|nr:SIS domain-containing protein [Eubacteriales bacterium]